MLFPAGAMAVIQGLFSTAYTCTYIAELPEKSTWM